MIVDRLPKISCVTVTKDRPKLLQKAIACYHQQTYPYRELVIVSQSQPEINQEIRDHLSVLGDSSIAFFEASPSLSLGAMRNLSCEIATGEVICQWDDDDLYYPGRIRLQYHALTTADGNSACAFAAFLKYFVQTGDVFWCNWYGEGRPTSRFLPGSVMFYRRIFHSCGSMLYPEFGKQSKVQEDLHVLGRLLEFGSVAPIFEGHHYIYLYHGSNTYSEQHHRLTLDTHTGKTVMNAAELREREPILRHVFGLILDKEVTVRSLHEPVFVFSPISAKMPEEETDEVRD